MEGYKDVLAMHAAGFRHTVALCGTALCTGHIALLKRYTTSVRVMLDADKAGRKAADAIVPVLAGEGMEAVRIGLPEGDDPDSLFRRLGREAFAAYVREAVRQTRPSEEQVLLGRIRKGIGLLSGVAEAEKRERLLRVLEDCLTQLKGLSVGACRPATMDWRWV
ncbi:toprim domain-containing protein [Parabacteroides merdae]|nr:toprim domain-containing protein [Parabacteroides merdae]